MADIRPAEVFPPGEFIRDELHSRGWTQEDLAASLGVPLRAINEILKGRKKIGPVIAKKLASAFETTAEFWLNLESAFRQSLIEKDDSAVAQRARI